MNPKHNITVLYPVILPVPADTYNSMVIRDRVRFLSRHARKALTISAAKQNIALNTDVLQKDEQGVPLPMDGWYWSLTHKPQYTGGIFASAPIGMDIEKIKDCTRGLREKIADNAEWALSGPDLRDTFFRYWTAKESVLKVTGAGLSELSQCRISKIINDDQLLILYRQTEWLTEHFRFDGHMASVVKNDFMIKWETACPPSIPA